MSISRKELKEFYEKYASEEQKNNLDRMVTLCVASLRWVFVTADELNKIAENIYEIYHRRFFQSYWSNKK